MSVIMDGVMSIKTVMDDGTQVVLENLTRGGVCGAYKILLNAQTSVTATCETSVMMFTIDRDQFINIVDRDFMLRKRINKLIEGLNEKGIYSTTLDYIMVQRHIDLPNGGALIGEQAVKASKLK